jgi:hypothetical protein
MRPDDPPKESFALRAQFDLPRDVALNLSWRCPNDLASNGFMFLSTDSLDMRVTWAMTPRSGMSSSVSNSIANRHREFTQGLFLGPAVTVGRTAFARFLWPQAK